MYFHYQCLWTEIVVLRQWRKWLTLKNHSSEHSHQPGLDRHNYRRIHDLNSISKTMARYLADNRARPQEYRLLESLCHLR